MKGQSGRKLVQIYRDMKITYESNDVWEFAMLKCSRHEPDASGGNNRGDSVPQSRCVSCIRSSAMGQRQCQCQ